jgi:hypothetical protein
MGITLFLLQNMICRDLVFKSSMGILDAFEYVLSLVMVDCGSYPLQGFIQKFHGSPTF